MGLWKKIVEYFNQSLKNNQPEFIKSEEEAIQYLIVTIPPKTWKDVKLNTSKFLNDHRFFGMYVRNLLREGGFNWGPIILDERWADLVRKALSKLPDDYLSNPCCDYCGKIIQGLPFENRWGQKFCVDHKVPETRGEHGSDHLPKEYTTTYYSNGTTGFRK